MAVTPIRVAGTPARAAPAETPEWVRTILERLTDQDDTGEFETMRQCLTKAMADLGTAQATAAQQRERADHLQARNHELSSELQAARQAAAAKAKTATPPTYVIDIERGADNLSRRLVVKPS